LSIYKNYCHKIDIENDDEYSEASSKNIKSSDLKKRNSGWSPSPTKIKSYYNSFYLHSQTVFYFYSF